MPIYVYLKKKFLPNFLIRDLDIPNKHTIEASKIKFLGNSEI